ncbi:hypothetical protein SAMN04488038_11924 [Solimonas aquatica]|uniref:Methyltransferase domain-containing protein n=1 Tax=Solimonas aquatica TaxID=489703 RepID=A0A1H9M7T7_9GAMM|nr:class I SAM-dependent methyltransferase [Solimonas aquatica]SER19193.1 hypothetical protein SAMN04488038_11924 [Solimonas aquatica]
MLETILDRALQQLHRGETTSTVHQFCRQLSELRLRSDDQYWNEVARPFCARHEINQILLQDPHTARAREKPRGYAGDAVMLDHHYFRTPPPDISDIGRRIFEGTTSTVGAEGVRWRLQYLAQEIDRLAAGGREPRILSLACGHLREAGMSAALRAGRIAKIYAVDQDAESLAVVRQDYGSLAVEIIHRPMRDILNRALPLPALDLAYAAGLYDYLPEPVAQTLTACLFDRLAPGGKLIVPNFLADNMVRGYMELFMDWNLIVRSPAQIEALDAAVDAAQIAQRRYHQDPFGTVGYLELVKRG